VAKIKNLDIQNSGRGGAQFRANAPADAKRLYAGRFLLAAANGGERSEDGGPGI
jgi:hypothetical protein